MIRKSSRRKVAIFMVLAFVVTILAWPFIYQPDAETTVNEPLVPVEAN